MAYAKRVAGGWRPELFPEIPENWKKLISECWDPELGKRPSFGEIIRKLREISEEETLKIKRDKEFLKEKIRLENNSKNSFAENKIEISSVSDSDDELEEVIDTENSREISGDQAEKREEMKNHYIEEEEEAEEADNGGYTEN